MDKKIAYLNCASGIAGDMFLASFIHAGISPATLETLLKRQLRFDDFSLKVQTVHRHHFGARRLDVKGDRSFGSPSEMRQILMRSALSKTVKERACAILDRLVRAESRVHGVPENKVHFHELNSVDTLIDVTGACLVLELAGIDEVHASPVNVGNPAPATLEMLKDRKVPVYSTTERYELATPTGIAILSTIARSFCGMPLMEVENSGFGAGTQEMDECPNLLKVIIGQPLQTGAGRYCRDTVVILSTNIDDMDPRIYPYVIERLLSAGAKDAWLTHILMKKGRPAIQLSAIVDEEHERSAADIIFRETTTLGIRRQVMSRYLLEREISKDRKIAYLPGGKRKVKSEFELARKKAVKTKTPLSKILV